MSKTDRYKIDVRRREARSRRLYSCGLYQINLKMRDGPYLVLIDIAFAMIMEKHSSSTFHKVLLKQKDYNDNKRKI